MDQFAYTYYRLNFENTYVIKRGTEIQNLFCRVMEAAYPGDFISTRPWGDIGDLKNDGYLRSKRQLFQVYAPNEMKRRETEEKMTEDFNGALPHWEKYFNEWTFVHNCLPGVGVPPFVTQKLLEFHHAHPDITCTPWGCQEVMDIFMGLPMNKMSAFFGWPPSPHNMVDVRIADIQALLDHITGHPVDANPDVTIPPADKLRLNDFSPDTEIFIQLGFRRSQLVEQFFDTCGDPTYAPRVAKAFRDEYLAYKSQGLSPDRIFWALQRFIVGAGLPDSMGQNAAFAILSDLFERCDIFESVRN